MSMHTQLLRGLMALPVAALLFAAGLLAPESACVDAGTAPVATASATASALPRVEFHSMIPGALHIVRKVKLEG